MLLLGVFWVTTAQARVTKIVIDEVKALPSNPGAGVETEQIAGRAYGELDPHHAANSIINDIELVKQADGKVRYVATFVLTKPVHATQASGMMWHDVPNRGLRIQVNPAEIKNGDVNLASAWQGDNSGATAVRDSAAVDKTHWLDLPMARQSDGSPITGKVMGRIINRSGPGSQALIVQTNPVPYKPSTLDTRASSLVSRVAESTRGEVMGEKTIAPTDWAWARCDAEHPFPGVADARQICLKEGFDATKLYQVVYPSEDAYALGIGFAAWRDVGTFFKHAKADDLGTPNPVAGWITHSIGRGVSQSGNFVRAWLHLGFNRSEDNTRVHDGLWPIIAGRRVALNFRWAQPDGVLELYQAGSEGPQWWLPTKDRVRGGAQAGLLDRCQLTKTCPKIIEHFGSAEVWALKLTPEWIGTDAKADLPLPANVRRYYIASSTHGGGVGGFNSSLPGAGLPTQGATCPGNNYGVGLYPANPLPHTETVNAIRVHFRNWVMKGIAPPKSQWPQLADHNLVSANKIALGFPTLPQLRATAPEADFISPVMDYDWGPRFNANDASGEITQVPPAIKQVLPMYAPKVDVDGNELGGVPVVLLQAPLGTYLGWNITAPGGKPFHAGQICDYAGGFIPFAKTAEERRASGDPRLSLEERYQTHEGYVKAVKAAAQKAMAQGFLLPEDASRLLREAQESQVLH